MSVNLSKTSANKSISEEPPIIPSEPKFEQDSTQDSRNKTVG